MMRSCLFLLTLLFSVFVYADFPEVSSVPLVDGDLRAANPQLNFDKLYTGSDYALQPIFPPAADSSVACTCSWNLTPEALGTITTPEACTTNCVLSDVPGQGLLAVDVDCQGVIGHYEQTFSSTALVADLSAQDAAPAASCRLGASLPLTVWPWSMLLILFALVRVRHQ